MSTSSERQKMREALATYSLMPVGELADFLSKDADYVRELLYQGRIPFVNVGTGSKRKDPRVDPLDAAIFVLAEKANVTSEEFWEKWGPVGTVDRARRYVDQIRRVTAA